MKFLLPVLGVLTTGASSVLGQLAFTEPVTIDFNQGTLPGVYRYVGEGTLGPSIGEPGNWSMQGEANRLTFDSRAWAYNFNGNLEGTTHPFNADANNNGNETNRFDLFQNTVVTETYFPDLGPGNTAIRFDEGTWADKRITLKVNNNTGAVVTDWSISLDTWFEDNGLAPATLSLLVGTTFVDDGAGYTTLGSRTGTNTNAGFSSMETIGGAFNQSVADGDSLYIQIFYDMDTGGTAFVIDNLSVIPEPSTYAGFAALAAFAVVLIRRRRN